MKIITKKGAQMIVYGANLLGTGGGGTIESAQKLLKQMKTVRLVEFDELKNNDIVCTAFGVGGSQNCDPLTAIRDALFLFQNRTGINVSAIIPVEIGAESVATALFTASKLNLPLLDSDIVGLRSSPEVFLETITLVNLPRTPCVVTDDKGNNLIISKPYSYRKIERLLRNFAVSVGGDAFVVGYPLSVNSLKKSLPKGSVILAKKNGEFLSKLKQNQITLENFCSETRWKIVETGTIIKHLIYKSSGFNKGKYEIKSKKDSFTIWYKNENLVLLRNQKVLLTCPDSISLLNLDSFEGVNNYGKNINKRVAILVRKSIPLWRTKKGLKLFSPRNLGLQFKQRLL